MAVYVDDMSAPFGRMKMCHMMADTIPELFAMVDEIAVDRKWLQMGRYIHFDIAKSKRALAVDAGAVEVTMKEMVKRFRGVHIVPACAHCGTHYWQMVTNNHIFAGQNYSDRYPPSVALQNHGHQVRCDNCGIATCWWHYEWEALEHWCTRAASV